MRLKGAGFKIYAVSNGAVEGTTALFDKAAKEAGYESVQKLGFEIVSCDQVQKAKPNPAVVRLLFQFFTVWLFIQYHYVLQHANLKDGDESFFVAAHGWDCSAAKKAGFNKTCFLNFEEFDDCSDLFGTPDLTFHSFQELADKLVATS